LKIRLILMGEGLKDGQWHGEESGFIFCRVKERQRGKKGCVKDKGKERVGRLTFSSSFGAVMKGLSSFLLCFGFLVFQGRAVKTANLLTYICNGGCICMVYGLAHTRV